jgi:hypothetical protein
VQILQLSREARTSRIIAVHPEFDPRGLGYAAIVTSDMFGIAPTLDQPTHLLLERQRAYAGKEHLSREELEALSDINAKLERLGFRIFSSRRRVFALSAPQKRGDARQVRIG